MRNAYLRFIFCAGISFAAASPALADITGKIDATITLEAGCLINGQNLDNGASTSNFGTIAFETSNTLFTQTDATVVGGSTGIDVQCSLGVSPIMTFGVGQHDGQGAGVGLRAMAHETASNKFVTYNLYSDAGRANVISFTDDLPLLTTGAAQTINIYARAFGETGLTVGTYTDEIMVTLEL